MLKSEEPSEGPGLYPQPTLLIIGKILPQNQSKATPLQPDCWGGLSEKSSLPYPNKPWQRFQSYCWAYVFSLYRNLTDIFLTVLQWSVLAVGETFLCRNSWTGPGAWKRERLASTCRKARMRWPFCPDDMGGQEVQCGFSCCHSSVFCLSFYWMPRQDPGWPFPRAFMGNQALLSLS